MSAPVTTAPDLRQILLDALSDSYWSRRANVEECRDCRNSSVDHCLAHERDYELAVLYGEAAALIREAAVNPAALASILAALGAEGETS